MTGHPPGGGGAEELAGDDRGQTLQDYAIGIGVFILIVAFVFTLIPSILTPFQTAVGASEDVQADRASDVVLEQLAPAGDNVINTTRAASFLGSTSPAGLRTALSLDDGRRVNVTIRSDGRVVTTGGVALTAGDPYQDQASGLAVRVVRDSGSLCTPQCLVIVRVW